MPALRISNLGRTIRRNDGELRVVESLDLVLAPGAAVGITGPIDAGWRSALRLIVGLDPKSSGTVELLARPGESAPALLVPELRQRVVFASALDPLLDLGLEHVAGVLPRLAASRRRPFAPTSAAALAQAAGVTEGASRAGRPERLRLCLALAMALAPDHVLLEVEPPLSSTAERRPLVGMIRDILGSGRGMLIGSRDEILLASVAATVLILEDGRILAEGTPETMLPAASSIARSEGLA